MKKIEDDKILDEIISSLKNQNEDYIEGSWEKFQKKRAHKKKRKIIIAIFSGGIAAMLLLSMIIYTTLQNNVEPGTQSTLRTENKKTETNVPSPGMDSILPGREIPSIKVIESKKVQLSEKSERLVLASASKLALKETQSPQENNKITAPADSNKVTDVTFRDSTIIKTPNEINYNLLRNKSNHKKFSFGFLVKESMNSTHSSSDISFAFGIVNEVKLNNKLSVSTGLIFDRYNLNYKYDEVYSNDDPVSVNAELVCLDIPLNIKMQVAEMRQSGIFISGGISTLAFIQEKYNQEYVFGDPTKTTVNFGNVNFAGQLNLSSGWQYHISNKMNVTVEAYMKIPLYKLAEENLHFYQSGVSVKISR